MAEFKVGYSQVNINPPIGAGIAGYYIPRFGKGFLDDIEASVLAIKSNEIVVLASVDMCGLDKEFCVRCSANIEKVTNVPKENIFMSATHTHTASMIVPKEAFEADLSVIEKYADFLESRITDAVVMALSDLKDAKLGFMVGYAPERVAYIRRYRMKDGSVCTCPPINDPNIDHPIGELDNRVNVVRFDRVDAESIVLVNYGLHADTTNGEMFSSDWPGWMRRTLDKALDGTKCIFFNGAEGDVGSTNVYPTDSDMNDTEISFDNEMKSPGMARFVGRALAGTVLQVYDKVQYTDVNDVRVIRKKLNVPSNMPDKKDLPIAHKYKELHEAGKDDEIPYTAMELTTVVAEALRMCKFENGPESFELELIGVKIGPIAMIGIPGEPFTEIGVEIKNTDGWDMILPCVQTNGEQGYFPVDSAYDEGGYEARTSRYKAGVGRRIVDGSRELLNELKSI